MEYINLLAHISTRISLSLVTSIKMMPTFSKIQPQLSMYQLPGRNIRQHAVILEFMYSGVHNAFYLHYFTSLVIVTPISNYLTVVPGNDVALAMSQIK